MNLSSQIEQLKELNKIFTSWFIASIKRNDGDIVADLEKLYEKNLNEISTTGSFDLAQLNEDLNNISIFYLTKGQ